MNTVTNGLISRDARLGLHDVQNQNSIRRWQERCWALLGYWPNGNVERWQDLTTYRKEIEA